MHFGVGTGSRSHATRVTRECFIIYQSVVFIGNIMQVFGINRVYKKSAVTPCQRVMRCPFIGPSSPCSHGSRTEVAHTIPMDRRGVPTHNVSRIVVRMTCLQIKKRGCFRTYTGIPALYMGRGLGATTIYYNMHLCAHRETHYTIL